jgi:hypothetical protein
VLDAGGYEGGRQATQVEVPPNPIKLVEVGTNRMRFPYFADPEGHVLEVMER